MALSARSRKALGDLATAYQAHCEGDPHARLPDVCYTANTGRRHFDHRLAVVAETCDQLCKHLRAFGSGTSTADVITGEVGPARPKVALLFTGQGSQYPGMGRELYDNHLGFRKVLGDCDEILFPLLNRPLLEILFATDGGHPLLGRTAYSQPALFALEYALAELWRSWGIVPEAVMGHGVGEYVAACVAGVFSLEDGLKLVAERARLMQDLPAGEMWAVRAGQHQVSDTLRPYEQDVSIAAINGEEHTVIAGTRTAVQQLRAAGVSTRLLDVSHASHAPTVESIRRRFESVLATVSFARPRIDMISTVTGQLHTGDVATPEYWCRQMREPVQFRTGIEALSRLGCRIFVESGPDPALLELARECVDEGGMVWLPSLRRGQSDWLQMLRSLGELYVRGMPVDWVGYDRDYCRNRVALPTYPFQRQRYWFDTSDNGNGRRPEASASPDGPHEVQRQPQPGLGASLDDPPSAGQPSPADRRSQVRAQLFRLRGPERLGFLLGLVQQIVADILGYPPSQVPDPGRGFAKLGMDSLMSIDLWNRLQDLLGCRFPVTVVFDHPSAQEIAGYLDGKLAEPNPRETRARVSESEGPTAPLDVEGLSEDEVEACLATRLASLETLLKDE